MADDRSNGSHPRPVAQAERPPRPVPELPADAEAAEPPGAEPAAGPVTDEDRNRFGALLDHAAERGLLSSTEYQVRLRELAEATSLQEMTTIVTELPRLTRSTPGAAQPGAIPDLPAFGPRQAPGRRRASPWAMLAVVLVVVVVALVFLAVYAEHMVHDRTGSGQPASATLSAPRL